ncbi:MAG: tetratricopeptide repeat protein [Pirellulales bacterium]
MSGRVQSLVIVLGVGGALAAVAWWWNGRGDDARPSVVDGPVAVVARKGESDAVAFAAYAGSESCRACHAEQFEPWRHSHHGLAERPLDPKRDDAAFEPTRTIEHGTQSSTVRKDGEAYVVETLGAGDRVGPHVARRVIGESPLWQFIVDAAEATSEGDSALAEPVAPGKTPVAPGKGPVAPHSKSIGRQQVLELSYDPAKNEWFNVYGDEDRRPGEWGHWTGRGMNWNSMCATCHNTRVRKNYDLASDNYATAMAEATVSCEACHGPMRDHVDWQHVHGDKSNDETAAEAKAKDPTARKLTSTQWLAVCGSCHSRRGELTGDFVPGDSYFDDHTLVVPDLSELFYADGQIHEEDYEFTSFLSSRMYASGVNCLHCHDPHRGKPLAVGNALCLKCHNGSFPKSPRIDVATHTFHKADSTGSQCVNCHMPQTVYMQRHRRHDHGFTIPDPLLTKQHGIPNACNRCHEDKDADWSLAAVEKWYGERMNRPTRRRAQAIAAARNGDVEKARGPLLAMLADENNVFWQASAATLLRQGGLLERAEVQQALVAATEHKFPLVREKAALALEPLVDARHVATIGALHALLDDSTRSVRVAAGWALRAHLDETSPAGKDVLTFLRQSEDQPGGAMQRGTWHLARREVDDAVTWFARAVKWDPNSAPIRDALAVGYSMQSRPADAVRQLEAAVRIAPRDAEYWYKLGLGRHELATNESGSLAPTIAALTKAVELDAHHGRAWYNLGVALDQTGDPVEAVKALVAAEKADPRRADIPYALATIYAKHGRLGDARAAAERALAVDPNYTQARQLLQSLGGNPGP